MDGMIHWPLSSVELVTPRLRLHVPSAAELDALAGLAAAGIHHPQYQPFTVAWTDPSPDTLDLQVRIAMACSNLVSFRVSGDLSDEGRLNVHFRL